MKFIICIFSLMSAGMFFSGQVFADSSTEIKLECSWVVSGVGSSELLIQESLSDCSPLKSLHYASGARLGSCPAGYISFGKNNAGEVGRISKPALHKLYKNGTKKQFTETTWVYYHSELRCVRG